MLKINEIYERCLTDIKERRLELEKRELENCIVEAIKSGDFMQHIQQGTGAFKYTYIPYREVVRLHQRVQKLEEMLDWYSNGTGIIEMESNYDIYIQEEE